MQTVKIIIGILSILIAAVAALQTYALGVITNVAGDLLGGLGLMTGTVTAAIFLIGGLLGIITCDNKIGGIVTGIIFLGGSVVGFYKMGDYRDLIVWAIAAAVFFVVFLLGSFLTKQPAKAVRTG